MAGFKSNFTDHAGNAASSVSDVAAEFAMMGISSKVQTCPFGCDSILSKLKKNYDHLKKLYNDSFIQVQAYKNTDNTLELQKDWYHKTQLALEEKVRILSANLENTTNTLKYTETLYDQAKIEKKEWEFKLVESLARTKLGLGFKEIIGSDDVFDLSTPSVFDPEPENREVKSLYESDKSSKSKTSEFASCVSRPKTNDSSSTIDVKILPKSNVKDPSPTNGIPSCSFTKNVKPHRNLCNKSGIADMIHCKNNFVRTKTSSVHAGSRNSSASIFAGRSIPAASRNRLESIHAGRHIPAGRFDKPAPFPVSRSVPTGWTNHAARLFFRPTNLYFDNVYWPRIYDNVSMNERRWGSAVKSLVDENVTQNWMVFTFQVPFWNEKWLVQGGTALELDWLFIHQGDLMIPPKAELAQEWPPRVTLGRLLPHVRGLGFKPRYGGFPSGAKKEWSLSPKAKVRVLHTAQLDVTEPEEDSTSFRRSPSLISALHSLISLHSFDLARSLHYTSNQPIITLGIAKVLERIGDVAYKLDLPEELRRVHNAFHVSNLKKFHADEPLAVSLDGLQFDDKLYFVEEPVEIIDREVKRLKQSQIPLVKVASDDLRDALSVLYLTSAHLRGSLSARYKGYIGGLVLDVTLKDMVALYFGNFAPPSPNYIPGPEEPEQAPPSPDYVPGPEHADDEIVAEDQPYAEDASPITQSPEYVLESNFKAHPGDDDDEDPEEDPEEEHLAPADFVVVAPTATDQAPSAEET
nr:putative reverse transcriptase domain-containing protein [Tanacetum cinerariifolium]